MDQKLIEYYWDRYGRKYLSRNIARFYPETKIIPHYLLENFPGAQIVLDLGFGTGLWFWASFLPGLARLDGIDLHAEALEAANRVFQWDGVPEGYAAVHGRLGRKFTRQDLEELAGKRGDLFFFDYSKTWPRKIRKNHYDLITEHGGGFGEMQSEDELSASVINCAKALKNNGCLFFANFRMKSSASRPIVWNEEVFFQAVRGADMEMVDFQTATLGKKDRATSEARKIFYGYARKSIPPRA